MTLVYKTGVVQGLDINHNEVVNFIMSIDDEFSPNISERYNIADYVKKLTKLATFIHVRTRSNTLIGILAFYANDIENHNAFISILGVKKNHRKKGVAKQMLTMLFKYLNTKEFETVSLEVSPDNVARHMYESLDFKIIRTKSISGNYLKFVMEKKL